VYTQLHTDATAGTTNQDIHWIYRTQILFSQSLHHRNSRVQLFSTSSNFLTTHTREWTDEYLLDQIVSHITGTRPGSICSHYVGLAISRQSHTHISQSYSALSSRKATHTHIPHYQTQATILTQLKGPLRALGTEIGLIYVQHVAGVLLKTPFQSVLSLLRCSQNSSSELF
jgi:hypothetical protein